MKEELCKMLIEFAKKIESVVASGDTDENRFNSAAQDVTDRIDELIIVRINEHQNKSIQG